MSLDDDMAEATINRMEVNVASFALASAVVEQTPNLTSSNMLQ